MSDPKQVPQTNQPHVLITIGKDGEMTVEGMNYPNATCGIEVGQVLSALGVDGETDKKPEYYLQDTTQQQSQNQS